MQQPSSGKKVVRRKLRTAQSLFAQRIGKTIERKVKAPATVGTNVRVGAPRINGGRSFVVSHMEYLDSVVGIGSWDITDPTTQIYTLQPGLSTEFPWLSTVAGNFEQYRWKKLRFHYRASAPTSTSGKMYMATQLNVNDAQFTAKAAMYNYTGTTSNSVWSNFTHDCLLKRGDYLKKYFIRVGALDTSMGNDYQMYDQGKFTFVPEATVNLTIGDLLVEYEIELFNPKTNPDLAVSANLIRMGTTADLAFPFSVGENLDNFAPWRTAKLGISTTGLEGGSWHVQGGAYQATSTNLSVTVTIAFPLDASGIAPIATFTPGLTAIYPTQFNLVGNSVFDYYFWFAGYVEISLTLTSAASPVTHNPNTVLSCNSFANSFWNFVTGQFGPTQVPGAVEYKIKPGMPHGVFGLPLKKGPIRFGNLIFCAKGDEDKARALIEQPKVLQEFGDLEINREVTSDDDIIEVVREGKRRRKLEVKEKK